MQVLRIADEKVDLAHQIYDHVDKHICSLDKDLRNFDADLQNERSRLGLPVRPFPWPFTFTNCGLPTVSVRQGYVKIICENT